MATKLLTPLGGGVTLEAANTATDKTLTLPADNGTVVYANSSGNVGIGTDSPAAKLEVQGSVGNIQVTSTGNRITYTRNSANYIGASGASASMNYVANTHSFYNGDESTEYARIDSSGNFKFNSGYGSVATAYGCRAWVNFNGTGTVAIRASGNVSSITDNGTGDYTVNMTTAMPDANYGWIGTARNADTGTLLSLLTGYLTQSTSAFRMRTTSEANGARDSIQVSVSVFR